MLSKRKPSNLNTADLKVEVNVVMWNILIFSNTCKMLSYNFFTLPSILLSNFALLVFKLRSYYFVWTESTSMCCLFLFYLFIQSLWFKEKSVILSWLCTERINALIKILSNLVFCACSSCIFACQWRWIWSLSQFMEPSGKMPQV